MFEDFLGSVLTAGGMATLVLEGIKYIVRLIKKDPNFDFGTSFYAILLPILTFLAQPLLALLDVTGYVIPTDWQSWVTTLISVMLGALASVDNSIKKLKNYRPANG
jgi:hypothetical protein